METPSIDTFEVAEKPAAEAVAALPTREEAKAQGLTAAELDRAEKRGMVAAPVDPAAKKEDPKEEPTEDVKEEVKPEAKVSTLPDFTFKTPEQEKAFLDAFGAGTPQRGLYFRMKNERQARQAAEQERDKERTRAQELEVRIAALEKGTASEVDDEGNVIDPEDKPLTIKQLRELQKAEAEAAEKKNQENEVRATRLVEAQTTQEEHARSVYPDFDPTVDLVKDLVNNLDTLVPEPWKQKKIISKVRELQIAAAQADKIDLDDYHAALIAYEIGQMHPRYGKTAEEEPINGHASETDGTAKGPKPTNGRHTPEQMKRIAENTQRRASSASVSGGGGSRTVSADDVDATTLDKMPYKERQKFREKHPARYAALLRG